MPSFIDIIKELELPKEEYVVIGSCILDILGIRKAKDIDLVVSNKIVRDFKKLKKNGWKKKWFFRGFLERKGLYKNNI